MLRFYFTCDVSLLSLFLSTNFYLSIHSHLLYVVYMNIFDQRSKMQKKTILHKRWRLKINKKRITDEQRYATSENVHLG